MTISIFFTPQLLMSVFWFTSGVYIFFGAMIAAGYIFYRISINRIKGEKADLQRQLTESRELLKYASVNEQKAREEVARSKKELFAKLSHEIRTPLNSMLGMTALLNETKLSGEQRECVSAVLSSGEKLVAFIREVLVEDGFTGEQRKLPAAPAANASNGSLQKPESRLSAEFARQYPLNILIAEDDAMNQQMVKMVLKKLGYEAQVATNGKEVLEVVSQKSFDLILMDVQMPHMDGLEATRMIRLCLEVQPVIIAMTANTMQGDREECLRAGMDDYLAKPLKIKELVAALEKQAKPVEYAEAAYN